MKSTSIFSLEVFQRAANSTASLSVVVTLALVLTLLAIGYHPPDPVFQASKVMDQVLSTVRNATFSKEDSVLVTAEDIMGPVTSEAAQILGPALEENVTVSVGVCDPGTTFINCSDPDVLVAIQLANEKKFPDMGVFQYGVPVRGSKDATCDVAWRFKPRHEKSPRMYRDYREYKLHVNTSCDYVVEKIGGWHSGKNALFQQADLVNDAIMNRSLNTFWSNKYLYYDRGGDYCKSMNQYLWSFLCALGEAQYLNRTLVMDLNLCLSGSYSADHRVQEGKDFRFYFDYEHLQKNAAVVDHKQFTKRLLNWNRKHPQHTITYRVVDDFKVSPMVLQGDANILLWRKFEQPEPNNYWYRVCEGEPEKVIQRPWNLLWKSKRLTNMVNSICGEMEWDFDAVHVVRGNKAEDKERWPNLDRDTMPEAILKKLDKVVAEGRTLYIASNEMLEGYFDKLRAKYRVHLLNDFKNLWAPGSLWYNQSLLLTRNKAIDFDGYMRQQVDSEVFLRARKRIETFGYLTNDCKDGINTC